MKGLLYHGNTESFFYNKNDPCLCSYVQKGLLFSGFLFSLMTAGYFTGWINFEKLYNLNLPFSRLLFALHILIWVFSGFIFLMFRPIRWVKCKWCGSRFSDTIFHNTEIFTDHLFIGIRLGAGKLVTHCRMCGHESWIRNQPYSRIMP